MVNAIQKHARHDLGVTLSLPCRFLVWTWIIEDHSLDVGRPTRNPAVYFGHGARNIHLLENLVLRHWHPLFMEVTRAISSATATESYRPHIDISINVGMLLVGRGV